MQMRNSLFVDLREHPVIGNKEFNKLINTHNNVGFRNYSSFHQRRIERINFLIIIILQLFIGDITIHFLYYSNILKFRIR